MNNRKDAESMGQAKGAPKTDKSMGNMGATSGYKKSGVAVNTPVFKLKDSKTKSKLREKLIKAMPHMYGDCDDCYKDLDKVMKVINKAFSEELDELEGEAQDVVYVASEKDKKIYSDKPSKAVPLSAIKEMRKNLK